MKLSHEDYDQLTVLAVRGELEGDEADRFRKAALERMDAKVRDFVLDLGEMEHIDSQGLEALLWLQDQCAENLGQVRLACPKPHVRTILHMTRLAGRFDTHDDVDTAIHSLR